MILEILVVALGLGVLLADLWTPAAQKAKLGAILPRSRCGIDFRFGASRWWRLHGTGGRTATPPMYVMDGLAIFFKQVLSAGGALWCC